MRRATHGTINSYSVTFAEDEFDESGYAERIAQQFHTAHQRVTVTPPELLAKLPNALAALRRIDHE